MAPLQPRFWAGRGNLPGVCAVFHARRRDGAILSSRRRESGDMSSSLKELPETLRSVRTAPLFVMRLVVPKVISVGATPGGFRRLGVVSGGTFEGERLSGEVLDGGNDWQDLRDDGRRRSTSASRSRRTTAPSSRCRTAACGTAPPMCSPGSKRRGGRPGFLLFSHQPDVRDRVGRYGWLNRIVAIGVGHRFPQGPVYSVFEVL